MISDKTIYIGFWIRFAAMLVDTGVVLLALFPILLFCFGWGYFDPHKNATLTEFMDLPRMYELSLNGDTNSLEELARTEAATDTGSTADTIVSYVVPIAIILAFWIASQATPGKMLFSAHIVDAKTGGKPQLWQWILRYAGYFVSLFPFGLGFLWILFDPRKQGWHDKMARTVVVHIPKPSKASIPPPLPPL